jgi:hypothetical protein
LSEIGPGVRRATLKVELLSLEAGFGEEQATDVVAIQAKTTVDKHLIKGLFVRVSG